MKLWLLLGAAALGFAADPSAPFQAGDGGYEVFRIPGLIVTKKGTLLAYAEARASRRGDWGKIDLVMRRSTDGGRSWEPLRKVADVPGSKEKNPVALAQGLAVPGEVTYNNPVAIADQRRGRVHFLFCLEYRRAFTMRSDDDGLSFSQPVEITSAFEGFRAVYPDWRVLAIGPGHGIQLRNGRLLASVWLSTGSGGHAHRPSVAATIFSDDAGQSWHAGEIVIPNHADFINPSEATLAQLPDGRVLFNGRTEAKQRRRTIATSPDGARHWTAPRFAESLPDPVCFGSLLALRRGWLAFVNPASTNRRENLTIRFSQDGGQTWPEAVVLDAGPAGYADLATDRRGNIYCLWEAGAPLRALELRVISPPSRAKNR